MKPIVAHADKIRPVENMRGTLQLFSNFLKGACTHQYHFSWPNYPISIHCNMDTKPDRIKKPWIETPLIESATLSQQAGW
jgi:hypothetical protein